MRGATQGIRPSSGIVVWTMTDPGTTVNYPTGLLQTNSDGADTTTGPINSMFAVEGRTRLLLISITVVAANSELLTIADTDGSNPFAIELAASPSKTFTFNEIRNNGIRASFGTGGAGTEFVCLFRPLFDHSKRDRRLLNYPITSSNNYGE